MSTTNVQDLASLASTSLASYANLGSNLISSLTDPTDGANFTTTQAEAFAERYALLSQQANVDLNGFSAAVFLDKVTGEKVLAIRGTEFSLGQIVTDFAVADALGIGAAGFANLQAIELYRYWKKLTTPGGQAVNYSDDEVVKLFMMANAQAIELGSLVLQSGTEKRRGQV
jgi:hypothetical protein